jgi:hypothetical protein
MSLLTPLLEPAAGNVVPAVQETSRTFPTQYAGRLVSKPILRELTDYARQERLQIAVDRRPRLFTVLLDVTVKGDVNAVERFGWFVDWLLRYYSFSPGAMS